MDNGLYNQPDLFVSFQEYNPADPSTPGPLTKWKVFGQWIEFEIAEVTDTDSEAVPAVTTTHSGGSTSTAAAHTIVHTITKNIAKEFTVFYCYAEDGIIKKVLPQHITVLNYKKI